MITDGLYRLTGLKNNDISSEIDNIINSANDAIIICGYSFTQPANQKSTLKKIINSPAPVKHCIFPIDLFKSRDVNRPFAIELINNGVSVSLEPDNHSKWLMTENEIYFGSANFTNYSIEKRIEVVTFKTFSSNDLLKNEFIDFTTASMKRMNASSNRGRIRGVITKNSRIIRTNKSLIKRLNPSVKKVISTLDSIAKVQSAINEILVNSFWLLDNKYYFKLTQEAAYYSGLIRRINASGNRIIHAFEEQHKYDKQTEYYNELCDAFTNSFENYYKVANDFIQSQTELPEFTGLNKKLIKENLIIIQNLIL